MISATKPDAWTLSPQMTAVPHLWDNMAIVVPFWDGIEEPRDIAPVRRNTLERGSEVSWDAAVSGRSVFGNAENTNARIEVNTPPNQFNDDTSILSYRGDDFTILWYGQIVSGAADNGMIYAENEAGGNRVVCYSNTQFGGANNEVRLWNADNGEQIVGPDLRGVGPTALAITKRGSQYRIFQDGVEFASASGASSLIGDDLNSSSSVYIGGDEVNSTRSMRGHFYFFAIRWDAMPDASARDFTADPFAMLRPAGF